MNRSTREAELTIGPAPATAAAPDHTGHRGHRMVRVAIGAVTVAAAVAVAANHRADPVTAALLSVTVLWYGVLSAIDIAQQRLPNRITLPLAGAAALAVLLDGLATADLGPTLAAWATGLGFAGTFVVLRFGMGDAKLALTVGMVAGWLGRDAVMATAYAGAVSGAVVALILIVIHRRRDVRFAFGPFLAIGSVAGMLVGVP